VAAVAPRARLLPPVSSFFDAGMPEDRDLGPTSAFFAEESEEDTCCIM